LFDKIAIGEKMSIVIKKIHNKKYAYIAYRDGKKVAQKYLGPVSAPEVAEKIRKLKAEKRIPERFYSLFWDTDPQKVDIRKNARYIIERVLEAGRLDALTWVQRLYPTNLIIETCEISRKVSSKSKNFWRIWFKYAS
jgi:hypothetical protein